MARWCMHGTGACMALGGVIMAGGICCGGGMHGRGHVWQGGCMAGIVTFMVGGMHGRGCANAYLVDSRRIRLGRMHGRAKCNPGWNATLLVNRL